MAAALKTRPAVEEVRVKLRNESRSVNPFTGHHFSSDLHRSSSLAARFGAVRNGEPPSPVIFSDTKKGKKDDKIIVICVEDPENRHYNDIKELSPHHMAEILRFFED